MPAFCLGGVLESASSMLVPATLGRQVGVVRDHTARLWFASEVVLSMTMGGRLSAADFASRFQTIRAAIEDAVSLARAAMDEAYELVQEATAHGWEGLAHAVQTGHDNLEVGVSNLNGARDTAERSQAGVADIRSVVSADEIADRLAGVIGQANEVQGALDVAVEAAGEAYVWAQQAEASRLMRMISALVESLDAAR